MPASALIVVEEKTLENEINSFPEIRLADDGSNSEDYATNQREFAEKKDRLLEVRQRLIVKLTEEADAGAAAMVRNVDTSGWTPETRALHDIGQRVNIGHYIGAAANAEGRLDGAAKEYNEAVLGDCGPGEFPMEMLLPRDEYAGMPADEAREIEELRAVITGVAAGTQASSNFMQRIFAGSDSAYMGATFPAVGPGQHAYPIVSGSTQASVISRGTAEVPAGGLSIETADPKRLQMSYEYDATDELTIPNIAAGLGADLRAAWQAGMDNYGIDQLIAELGTVTADNVVLTAAKTVQKFGGGVDGKSAQTLFQVRALVGNDTFVVMSGFSLADTERLYNILGRDMFRVSSHIAAEASTKQAMILYRTGGPAVPRFIIPVWRRASLLRDTGRLQLLGQITLTGVGQIDVVLVNSDKHKIEQADLS